MDFTHLHVHNEFSFLDGLGSAEEYVNKAKELEFGHLALTNHGNVDGCIKFQNVCEAAGIVPIIGCELYVVKDLKIKEKGEKRRHLTVFVKSELGWRNLLRMLTIANLEGHYYRPRVDPKTILDNSDGLVFSTACAVSVLIDDWGQSFVKELAVNRNVFLEIMPHKMKEQSYINELCLDFSKKHKIKIVATNDCHYINDGDEKTHEVLLAVQSKKKWNDPARWKFSIDGLFLRSKNEMIRSFRSQNELSSKIYFEALDNTQLIVDLCKDFRIPRLKVELPIVPGFPKEKTDEEILRELCANGLAKKGLDKKDNYKERMDEELDLIIGLGFARYFLIVWELIDWCKKNDIMVGPGRGSVGGSLVAYLLGITMVDPIEHGLIFARFISPARIDLPDIDMDFEDVKRPLIFKHLQDLYGVNSVAGASTFSTMKGRGALHDVSRVFDVPLVEVNKASKAIVVRSGGDFRCLSEGTEIYSITGSKKIETLQIGDRIASVHGNKIESRKVVSVSDNGYMDVFEMELESGKKIICSDRHRFWTKAGWKRLSELNGNDEILTEEKENIYHYCLNCNAIIYGKKKKFCCLSCTTKYRNLYNNPMVNISVVEKMKATKKGKRCKWHDDPIKMDSFRRKTRDRFLKNNPMKNQETVEKLRISLRKVMGPINRAAEKSDKNRQYMLNRLELNPDSHPLRILANNPRKGVAAISYYQNILSRDIRKIIARRYKVIDELPIKRKIEGKNKRNGHYYLDVAVPKLKINFEYDGDLHKGKEKEDKERDDFLNSLGWKVIRFNKRDLADKSYLSIIKESVS